MAQRGKPTTFEERIEIGERWEAGQSDPEIAEAIRCSVWTVRKWRRTYQKEGRSGLATRMGRPASGALGQYPPEIRQAVSAMREEHPGWGPVTIRTELEDDPNYSQAKIPSRSRIAAYLKQENLTRKYERHHDLPQPKAVEPQRAHQVWEVDAQGVIKIPGLGPVSLINIKDLFSRLKVASYPCMNTSHPNTLDYQLILRRAFVNWGLPEQVSLDHDSVFYDNASASPFPTILHLWLIGLDVEVRFIKKKPPAEHSIIERTHQIVTQQAIVGQSFSDGLDLEKRVSDRVDFLNLRYPSLSLGGQPPLMACPAAKYTHRPYRLEWEEEMLEMQRVYDYLSKGRWFRMTSSLGQFSLGAHRYNVGVHFPRITLEITFDTQTHEFVCLTEDGNTTMRFPSQGLTKADLMGELNPLITLPSYQLELPFSRETWRQIMLCSDLTGTTL
jgi:transposase